MNLSIVKSLFAFLVVFGLTKSFIIERRTYRFDYLENLAEDLEIFQDVNVRFVFDQGEFIQFLYTLRHLINYCF